jgi:GT2 family glycosyltransferase
MGALPNAGWSVVIPTRGRPEPLRRCLESLGLLDFAGDGFEVIVVDDGGGVDDKLVKSAGLSVTVIRQEHAGPAAARNRGAAAAAGAYLAFLDDDCVVMPGWLRGFARAMDERPGSAVGGRVVNGLPDNLFSTATETMIEHVSRAFARERPEQHFVTSNNIAVPRDEFLRVGGFDERFRLAAAEDRDFCARWLASGRDIVVADDAVVEHAHDLNLASFFAQHFAYGRGAYDFRSRDTTGSRGFGSPLFYLSLVADPLRKRRSRALGLSAALVVSQVATAAGYAAEAIDSRRRRR